MSNSYSAEDRIKTAGQLRLLAKDMTHGDPKTASMLLVAAKMIEHQPGPNSEDTKRIDFLEKSKATVYRAMTSSHWVFVDESDQGRRHGVIGKTLREAIDNASPCATNTGGSNG